MTKAQDKFDAAVRKLQKKTGELPASSQVKMGNLKLRDGWLYVRAEFTPGGKIPILLATVDKAVGVSNFDGNKLEDYRNFLVNSLKVGYSTNAASGKASELEYTTGLPPALKNAHLIISQGNIPLIHLPIAAIYNPYTSSANLDDKYKELTDVVLLNSGEPISIELEFAQGAAIASADKKYVEIALRGHETYLKQ